MNLTGPLFAMVAALTVILADRQLRRFLDRVSARETAVEKRAAEKVSELETLVLEIRRELSTVKSILALKSK